MPIKIHQSDVDYFYENIYSDNDYNQHPLCDFLDSIFTIYKKIDDEISYTDISNHLKITKGAVSLKMKNLCQLNIFKKTKYRHYESTSFYNDYKKNIYNKKVLSENEKKTISTALEHLPKYKLLEKLKSSGQEILELNNDMAFVATRMFNGLLDNCIRYGPKDKRKVIENSITYGSNLSGIETLKMKATCMSSDESDIFSIADLRYIRVIDTMITDKLTEIFKNEIMNNEPLDFSKVLTKNSFVINISELTKSVGIKDQPKNNANTIRALMRLEDTRFELDATNAPNFVALLSVARTLIGDNPELDFKELKKPKLRYFQTVEPEKEYEDLLGDNLRPVKLPRIVHVRLDPLHLGLFCLGLMRRNPNESVLHANHSGIEKEGGIISKIYNTAGSILRPSAKRNKDLVISYTWSDFTDRFASNQDKSNVYRDFRRVYSHQHDLQHGVGLFHEHSANLPIKLYGYIFHWEGRPEEILKFHNERKKKLHRNKKNSKTYRPIISISRDPDDDLIGDNSFSASKIYIPVAKYSGIDNWEPANDFYDSIKKHGIPKKWFLLEKDIFKLTRKEKKDDEHIDKSSEMDDWLRKTLLKKWRLEISALDQLSDPAPIKPDWMPGERVIQDLEAKGFTEEFIKEKAVYFRDSKKYLSRTWNRDFIEWMDNFNFTSNHF